MFSFKHVHVIPVPGSLAQGKVPPVVWSPLARVYLHGVSTIYALNK